jgi:hypothetical protein
MFERIYVESSNHIKILAKAMPLMTIIFISTAYILSKSLAFLGYIRNMIIAAYSMLFILFVFAMLLSDKAHSKQLITKNLAVIIMSSIILSFLAMSMNRLL